MVGREPDPFDSDQRGTVRLQHAALAAAGRRKGSGGAPPRCSCSSARAAGALRHVDIAALPVRNPLRGGTDRSRFQHPLLADRRPDRGADPVGAGCHRAKRVSEETGSYHRSSGEAAATSEQLVLELDGYEGPIDLLLSLAREQKVDLTRISILALADQYLAFIANQHSLKLEIAADYLVMAAWLAYLKSRLLLPQPQ